MHQYLEPGQSHGNVVFNFRRDPIGDLAAYAAGYRRAAAALVQRMDQASGYPDYDGYPIFFLYRHALELYLKAIVCKGAKLLELLEIDSLSFDRFFSDHRLSPLLPAFRKILEGVGWPWDIDGEGLRTFDDFQTLVRSIEQIDPGSFSFRYPINTERRATLPHHFVINVIRFGRCMDNVLELLDGAVTGLAAEWDTTTEAIYEIRQLLGEGLAVKDAPS